MEGLKSADNSGARKEKANAIGPRADNPRYHDFHILLLFFTPIVLIAFQNGPAMYIQLCYQRALFA